MLDTFDAEIKAPLLFDELGAGGGSTDFAGLNSSIGFGASTASSGKAKAAGPGTGTDLSFDGDDAGEAASSVSVTNLLEGNCDQERGALLILCLLATPEFVHPIVDAGVPLRLINLSKVRVCWRCWLRVRWRLLVRVVLMECACGRCPPGNVCPFRPRRARCSRRCVPFESCPSTRLADVRATPH